MSRVRLLIHALACAAVLFVSGLPATLAQEMSGTPEAMSTASESAAASAPMFRGNPAGTGEVPGPGPDGPPSILWAKEIGMMATFDQPTPAVGEGLVVASGSTGLVAFDAETGAERWRSAQPLSTSSPLIWDGRVYIGTWGEGIKALDSATGEEIWQFLTGDAPVPDNYPPDSYDSSPTISNGVLYVGQGPYGGLFALDPSTGQERWRFDTHGGSGTSPAVRDGSVYIASDALWDVDAEDPTPSALYAVDAATGEERWHVDFGPDELTYSSPVATKGAVVIGVTNPMAGTAYYLAVDPETGDELWRVDLEGPLWVANSGASGDLVYLAGGESPYLLAVDAATGEERWRFAVKMSLFPGPTIADGAVYLQSQDGYLTALDAATGAEHWRMLVGSGGSPVVADGKIYTGAWGNLVALGDAEDPGAATFPACLCRRRAVPAARTPHIPPLVSRNTGRSRAASGSGSQRNGPLLMRRWPKDRSQSSFTSAAVAGMASTRRRKRSIPGSPIWHARGMSSSRRSTTVRRCWRILAPCCSRRSRNWIDPATPRLTFRDSASSAFPSAGRRRSSMPPQRKRRGCQCPAPSSSPLPAPTVSRFPRSR